MNDSACVYEFRVVVALTTPEYDGMTLGRCFGCEETLEVFSLNNYFYFSINTRRFLSGLVFLFFAETNVYVSLHLYMRKKRSHRNI